MFWSVTPPVDHMMAVQTIYSQKLHYPLIRVIYQTLFINLTEQMLIKADFYLHLDKMINDLFHLIRGATVQTNHSILKAVRMPLLTGNLKTQVRQCENNKPPYSLLLTSPFTVGVLVEGYERVCAPIDSK